MSEELARERGEREDTGWNKGERRGVLAGIAAVVGGGGGRHGERWRRWNGWCIRPVSPSAQDTLYSYVRASDNQSHMTAGRGEIIM